MKKSIYTILFIITLFTGCSLDTINSPEKGSKPTGKITLNIDKLNAPANVAHVLVYLTNANFDTLTGIMNLLSDTTAGISFQNVAELAEDINGAILYKGETSVIVTQGLTSDVDLTLVPVENGTGNILITVNWGTINLGNAIYLDGTSAFVEVPNSSSLSSIDTAITIEAWIKPAEQYYNTIICKGLSNYGIEFAEGLYPGVFLMGTFATEAYYYWGRIMIPFLADDSQWSHIAITYSTSTGVRAYFNHNLVYSTPAYGTIQCGTAPLRIGARVDSVYTEYFRGSIDEVRIWKIVRSQNEIAQNMNKELTGSENGLIAYWKFNESSDSNNIIHDSTPNHNDGVIHGNVIIALHNAK
jgi:Concanavalin A-like lectin/glucanases superfamily